MKFPIGIQTFDKIIEGGYVYVDKTDLRKQGAIQGACHRKARERMETPSCVPYRFQHW